MDGGSLADAAWRVGREEGALGWLKNGWTMLRGLMGMDAPMELAVYYDDAVLRSAAAELAENFDQAPVDGSYELASDGRIVSPGAAASRAKAAAWGSRLTPICPSITLPVGMS